MRISTDRYLDENTHREDPPSEFAAPQPLAQLRSLKRTILEELRVGWEAGPPIRAEELLERWPGPLETDMDVASLLFEEYCQRHQHGERTKSELYEQCSRQGDLLHAIGQGKATRALLLSLPSVGDELFNYRLCRELGEGSFAKVFLAEQRVLADRPVVLKVSAIDGDEPQTLALLQHTHIMPIYSVHEDSAAGLRVTCMPYFQGASLACVLRALWADGQVPVEGREIAQILSVAHLEKGTGFLSGTAFADSSQPDSEAGKEPCPLFERNACPPKTPTGREETSGESRPVVVLAGLTYVRACAWIVARLAEALAHAHGRGILHRDLKPSNIFLTADGQPLLLDFNLAQNLNGDFAQAVAMLGGTVAYMAPEHLRALATRDCVLARHVDHRADIYGLGMVLFEMLTGRRPFAQSASYAPLPALIAAMAAERNRMAPSPRACRPDIPWSLESIVRKCLAPDPLNRYQQAEHLLHDLGRFLEDQPLRHAPELSWTERIIKWGRRHPRLMATGAVAAAGLFLFGLGGALLTNTWKQLQASSARIAQAELTEAAFRRQIFHKHAERARILVPTTHSLSGQHIREGLVECERAFGCYQVLQHSDWQNHPALRCLGTAEQRQIAEDIRELLLLSAWAQVYLAPATADCDLPNTLAAWLTSLRLSVPPLSRALGVVMAHTTCGPRARTIHDAGANALGEALRLLDHADAIAGLEPCRASWTDRATYLQALGELAGAEAASAKANAIPLASARDHYLLASTYRYEERYVDAIRELSVALELNPRHYWSCYQRGLCYEGLGKWILALRDYSDCVTLWPEFAPGYFNRGQVLRQLRQPAAAIEDFTRALEHDPNLVAAYVNRGLVRLEVSDYKQALADFDAAQGGGWDHALVHWGRGIALENSAEYPQSDAAFAEAFLRRPKDVELLLGYAFAISRRLPTKARSAFQTVLDGNPWHTRALYGCGMLYAQQERNSSEALAYFTAALAVDPHFVEARRGRANVLAHRGDSVKACEDIDFCLQAEPTGVTSYAAACVSALLANHATEAAAILLTDRALTYLGNAFAQGYGMDIAASDSDLYSLRRDPRFRFLLEQANTPR